MLPIQAMRLRGAGAQSDPNFANVVALMHLNDAIATDYQFPDAALAHAFGCSGSPRISSAQSKFGGYSAFFNAVGDYIVAPNDTANSMGTGDFTVEAWIYLTSAPAAAASIFDSLPVGAAGARNNSFVFYVDSSRKLTTFQQGATRAISTGTISTNTWTHVALTRASGTLRLFINGTIDGTGSFTVNDNLGGLVIGSLSDGATLFPGYIDEFRLSKGIARYTANFTPSASPFTPDANDVALLHMDAITAAVVDVKGHSFTTNGSAFISSRQKKFGVSALSLGKYESGYIVAANDTGNSMGTGDFTVEAWIYVEARSSNGSGIFDSLPIGGAGARNNSYFFYTDSIGRLTLFSATATVLTSTGAVPLNTWTHVAMTRASGTLRFFINGTLDGSASFTTNDTQGGLVIGNAADNVTARAHMLQGLLDDFRITKGVARYTASFTPPGAPFPDA